MRFRPPEFAGRPSAQAHSDFTTGRSRCHNHIVDAMLPRRPCPTDIPALRVLHRAMQNRLDPDRFPDLLLIQCTPPVALRQVVERRLVSSDALYPREQVALFLVIEPYLLLV
jgi:hypothetical protein